VGRYRDVVYPVSEPVRDSDSLSDITAAQAAGVPVIAYANKPSKKEQFAEAGADTVVTSMADAVAALRSGGPNSAEL
jgi:D-arabinose 1-dehydrogenase-like Zn-dependent alcohol dehydrogenase